MTLNKRDAGSCTLHEIKVANQAKGFIDEILLDNWPGVMNTETPKVFITIPEIESEYGVKLNPAMITKLVGDYGDAGWDVEFAKKYHDNPDLPVLIFS